MDKSIISNNPSMQDVGKLCLEQGSELSLMALEIIPIFKLPEEAETALMEMVQLILKFQKALAEIKKTMAPNQFRKMLEDIAKRHKVSEIRI